MALRRQRQSGSHLVTFLIVVGGLIAAVVVATGLLGELNPFRTTTKDHSPPPILKELRRMGDLHAAQAEFEVIIDQEDDVQYLPAAIAGERVQFVAIGTVDAVVDLSTIAADAIVYDEKTNSVVVTLPAPTIAVPVLDHEQSHVMNRDRGVFNRIAGVFSDNPTSEDALYQAASDKMVDAAAQSGLVAMGEQHTEELLEGMISQLGVDSVDIQFEDPLTQ